MKIILVDGDPIGTRGLLAALEAIESLRAVSPPVFAMTLDEAPAAISVDRIATSGAAQYYVSHKIGPKRSMTPEGFLLCEEVPLARTGELLYAAGETPIQVGDAGYLIVERSAEEVFRPEFIASFEGKPVTNDHPRVAGNAVTADNWRALARGTTINPRRGEGALSEFIVGDLLITDAATIKDVLEGKVEVSAGYRAQYHEISRGRARQTNMLANHVALVAAGRCGPRCSIQDHAPKGDALMTKDARSTAADTAARIKTWWEGIVSSVRTAIEKNDKVALDAALGTAPTLDGLVGESGEVHVHIDGVSVSDRQLLDSLKALLPLAATADQIAKLGPLAPHVEKLVADCAPAAAAAVADAESDEDKREKREESSGGTEDQMTVAADSSFLAASFQDAIAGAEVLVPGISLPKYDKAAKPRATLDAIAKLRADALDLAYSLPARKAVIDQLTGGKRPDVSKLTKDAVRLLFRSVVAAQKAIAASPRAAAHVADKSDKHVGPARTLAELNARNAAKFGEAKQAAK